MSIRVGIYVDAANVWMNGGRDLRYDVLHDFAVRDGAYLQRQNSYLPMDHERRRQDPEYRERQDLFIRRIRDLGWRIHEKAVKRFPQDDGEVVLKANADMELAIDALSESDRLDKIVLVTGDGDFVRLAQALQTRGCRVEVIGFRNVSRELRESADLYINGLLIPGLVPPRESQGAWGEPGSTVRGLLEHWNAGKGVGILRFLIGIDDSVWQTDHRRETTCYRRAFVPLSAFYEDDDPAELLRFGKVLEFVMQPNTQAEPPFMASACEVVS